MEERKRKEYEKRAEENVKRMMEEGVIGDVEAKYLRLVRDEIVNKVMMEEQESEWIYEERI